MKVTVSSKYQIAIPLEIRKLLNIKPGEKLEMIPFENKIELLRIQNIKKMKGFLKGMDTSLDRGEDRL